MNDHQTSIKDGVTPTRRLTIALVHNWPGKRNSEWDIVFRLRSLLEESRHEVLVLDPLGYTLDDEAKRMEEAPIADGHCDLVINLHFLNPKFLSGLSYTVNWNPVDYIVNDPITGAPAPLDRLNYLMSCMRSHDRVLTAGSAVVDQFAALIRQDRQGDYLPASEVALHTTIASNPETLENEEVFPAVNAETFSVFYIGMNWEKLSIADDRKVRHDGLLELLDQSGRFRFFGLRRQDGVFLWEGFEHYHGELPFDGGKSILEQSRRCGATLVLSSDQHRLSEVVSTRIFQACAAGSIIISDRNRFVEKHFGDAVLYFDYGESNRETTESILRQVRWIEENWQAAQQKAANAQRIFTSYFALEKEVQALCTQAQRDLDSRAALIEDLSARSVAIHYLIRGQGLEELARLLANVACQHHENVTIQVYAETTSVADHARRLAGQDYPSLDVQVIRLTEAVFATGTTLLLAVNSIEDYHLWYSEGFEWRRDHLLNLLTICERNDCRIAYAPYFAAHDNLAEYTQDTTRFFISGLNGGYSQLTLDGIEQLDLRDLPLGNILLASQTLKQFAPRSQAIEWADLASVALIIRETYREDPKAIGFSPVISTIHMTLQDAKHQFPYNEYGAFNAPWRHAQVRDKALLEALQAGTAILPAGAGKYSTQIHDSGGAPARGFSTTDPEALTEAISERFSAGLYIKHVLRNRPFLGKCLTLLHGALARLLKLN
jgi:hypothetical protein